MNIMELKKQAHLSASSINDYLDCGLLYKFSRIDKIKTDLTSDALELGASIHKALAEFYQEKMIGSKLSLQALQASFEKHWKAIEERSDIEYEEGHDWETWLKKGKYLLTTYYEKLPDDGFRVLAIEEPFMLKLDGLSIPIIGVFDLLEEDQDGTLIITDWKTTSKAYSIDQIDKSLQLTIYQMGIRANGYRDRDILLKFDCLIKTKTVKFEQYYTTRSELDERKAAKKILKVWQGISKGIFIPNDTSWKCNNCAYSDYCNEWLIGNDK